MIEVVKAKPYRLYMEGVDEAFLQAAIGRSEKDFRWELGGVGRLTIEDDGTITLGEPVILKQTVTTGSCEFHNHITEWLKTWAPESCESEMPNVNFYTWHSHNTMDTFRSGIDDEWISNYANMGLLVTLIGNHKGAWKAYIDTVINRGGVHMQHQLPCKLHVLHQERPEYVKAAEHALALRKELVELPSHTSLVLASARDSQGRFVGHGTHLTEPLEEYYLGRDGIVAVEDKVPFVPSTPVTGLSSFSKRLPGGLSVSDLAATHGEQLRIYFSNTNKPPYLVCFMCNARTMYTVDAGGPILNQLRLVFRISKKHLRKLIGSGAAINYVPPDTPSSRKPRWTRHNIQASIAREIGEVN